MSSTVKGMSSTGKRISSTVKRMSSSGKRMSSTEASTTSHRGVSVAGKSFNTNDSYDYYSGKKFALTKQLRCR